MPLEAAVPLERRLVLLAVVGRWGAFRCVVSRLLYGLLRRILAVVQWRLGLIYRAGDQEQKAKKGGL